MLRHTLIFFLHNHSEDLLHKRCFPCIYTYTRKQIKVIFYLNRSQWDMIFPFNDSSELTVSTLVVHANRGYVYIFNLILPFN